MKKVNAKLLAADIAQCALFVALMTAGANISIPFFPVPLTFQTVISVLAGLLLGWQKGVISMSVYCIMGLAGIPVFTGLGGGITYVLKPTFGYIIGFILSAFFAGIITGGGKLPFWRYLVAAVAAFFANYALGIPYFALIWQYYLHSPSLGEFIVTYNLLYMPKDLALCLLASVLAWRIVPHIKNGRNRLKAAMCREDEKNDKTAL